MPPAELTVSTPEGNAEVVDVLPPGVVVDVDARDVVEVVAVVVVKEDCTASDVELVVGTTSGAPALSLTSPDAAATTHHAARVTSVVASTHPRACRAEIICPSCPTTRLCVSEKRQGFPKTVVVDVIRNRLPGEWQEST